MALRTIRTHDDPILRKRCREVTGVDDRTRTILADMLDTLHNTPNGGAIAANQVGVLRRLVVVDLGEGVYQLVNPEILELSGEQYSVEGCLSFPGTWGMVRRPQHITVRALDEQGNEVTIDAEGFLAKCLCHEIDHLDGKVFIDKIEEMLEPGSEA